MAIDLRDYVRSVSDWPKEGILFRDITPMLADKDAFSTAVEQLADSCKGLDINCIVGVEARGFIFGAALAKQLQLGFVPIRKKGKLPYETEQVTYDLEYGTDTLEVHVDAFEKTDNVLMVDDLLATGGTMAAACQLVETNGGKIKAVEFVIELDFLKGREKLDQYKIITLLNY